MWILPTYNRPESLKNCLEQIKKIGISTNILVIVQGIKKMKDYYLAIESLGSDFPVRVIYLLENIGFCAALNYAFDRNPNEPWYGVFGDDEYVYTQGWDTKLIEAAESNKIAHGCDKDINNGRLHTYNVFGGELVRAVGYFAPQGLWHWYFDDVWERLAAECDLKRPVPEVVTEHRHYLYGKSPKDRTYLAAEEKAKDDEVIFRKWFSEEYPGAVTRINKISGK